MLRGQRCTAMGHCSNSAGTAPVTIVPVMKGTSLDHTLVSKETKGRTVIYGQSFSLQLLCQM